MAERVRVDSQDSKSPDSVKRTFQFSSPNIVSVVPILDSPQAHDCSIQASSTSNEGTSCYCAESFVKACVRERVDDGMLAWSNQCLSHT